MKTDRRSGRSTNAILLAPMNAIYVCPNHASIDCHKNLVPERPDVLFVSPSYITDRRYRGLKRKIVLDHHTLESNVLRNDELVDVFLHNERFK